MKRIDPHLTGNAEGDTLGRRWREARINAKLTQKEASLKIGLSAKQIGRIECGGVQMVDQPATMVRAAAAYGVPQVWLYAGAAAGVRFVPEWYRPEASKVAA